MFNLTSFAENKGKRGKRIEKHTKTSEEKKQKRTLSEKKKETEIRHLKEQVKYFQDKMHLEMKYTLKMVGKIGYGKSESGNTLLGRRVFHDYPGCDPGTLHVCKGKAKIQQELFEVFDTPGILRDDMSHKEGTVSAVQNATEIMNISKRGVTAFLFVYSLGSRYFQEDAQAIKILMDIYGPNAIHKFGICLLTFGDGFYDKKLTINEWFEQQDGALKDFLCRFNKRIVLMLNKGNQIERERCRAEVFDIVRQLSQQQDPYTKEDFKKQAAFHKEQKLKLKIFKFYCELRTITRENQLQLLARADKLINKKNPLNPGIDDEETITLQKVRTILQDIIKKPSNNKSQFTQLLHLLPS